MILERLIRNQAGSPVHIPVLFLSLPSHLVVGPFSPVPGNWLCEHANTSQFEQHDRPGTRFVIPIVEIVSCIELINPSIRVPAAPCRQRTLRPPVPSQLSLSVPVPKWAGVIGLLADTSFGSQISLYLLCYVALSPQRPLAM